MDQISLRASVLRKGTLGVLVCAEANINGKKKFLKQIFFLPRAEEYKVI